MAANRLSPTACKQCSGKPAREASLLFGGLRRGRLRRGRFRSRWRGNNLFGYRDRRGFLRHWCPSGAGLGVVGGRAPYRCGRWLRRWLRCWLGLSRNLGRLKANRCHGVGGPSRSIGGWGLPHGNSFNWCGLGLGLRAVNHPFDGRCLFTALFLV